VGSPLLDKAQRGEIHSSGDRRGGAKGKHSNHSHQEQGKAGFHSASLPGPTKGGKGLNVRVAGRRSGTRWLLVSRGQEAPIPRLRKTSAAARKICNFSPIPATARTRLQIETGSRKMLM